MCFWDAIFFIIFNLYNVEKDTSVNLEDKAINIQYKNKNHLSWVWCRLSPWTLQNQSSPTWLQGTRSKTSLRQNSRAWRQAVVLMVAMTRRKRKRRNANKPKYVYYLLTPLSTFFNFMPLCQRYLRSVHPSIDENSINLAQTFTWTRGWTE